MLVQAGIQFTRHEQDGINPQDFAELLMMSGLVLTPKVSWIAFHRWVGPGSCVGGACMVTYNYMRIYVTTLFFSGFYSCC